MNSKLLKGLVLLSSIFLMTCFLLFRSGFFNGLLYGYKKPPPVTRLAKSPIKKDSLIFQFPTSPANDDKPAEMFSSSKSLSMAIRIEDIIRFDSLANVFILEPKDKGRKAGNDISINVDSSMDIEPQVMNVDTTEISADTVQTFPKSGVKRNPAMMGSSKLGIVFTPSDFKVNKAIILYRQRKDSSKTKKENEQ